MYLSVLGGLLVVCCQVDLRIHGHIESYSQLARTGLKGGYTGARKDGGEAAVLPLKRFKVGVQIAGKYLLAQAPTIMLRHAGAVRCGQ